MNRRRIAFSVTTASALLVVAPLLTACGGTTHAGAAAIVGGKRITVSQLQGQVRDVRSAQQASPRAQQLISGSGRLSHDTLIRMIQYRVIAQAAQEHGVHISKREVQKARQSTEQRAGGGSALRAAYLQQGIAPGQIDQMVRMDLMRTKLLDKLGTSKVNETFADTSKSLKIEVNPRFGKWDDKQGTSVVTQEPWLRSDRNAASEQQQA